MAEKKREARPEEPEEMFGDFALNDLDKAFGRIDMSATRSVSVTAQPDITRTMEETRMSVAGSRCNLFKEPRTPSLVSSTPGTPSSKENIFPTQPSFRSIFLDASLARRKVVKRKISKVKQEEAEVAGPGKSQSSSSGR